MFLALFAFIAPSKPPKFQALPAIAEISTTPFASFGMFFTPPFASFSKFKDYKTITALLLML